MSDVMPTVIQFPDRKKEIQRKADNFDEKVLDLVNWAKRDPKAVMEVGGLLFGLGCAQMQLLEVSGGGKA